MWKIRKINLTFISDSDVNRSVRQSLIILISEKINRASTRSLIINSTRGHLKPGSATSVLRNQLHRGFYIHSLKDFICIHVILVPELNTLPL